MSMENTTEEVEPREQAVQAAEFEGVEVADQWERPIEEGALIEAGADNGELAEDSASRAGRFTEGRFAEVSDESDSMLVDAIPSLEEQRAIVNRLWEGFVKESSEGDKMYIVPNSWLSTFFDQEQTDYTVLGQLDIKSIVVDQENLILVPYETCPYTAVPEPVFAQWYEWYGLAEGSSPLCTYLVENTQGQLAVEYDRPKFRLHHLSLHEESHGYHHYGPQSPILFTMSRLHTVGDMVSHAIELFCRRENQANVNDVSFRTWYVGDSNTGPGEHSEYLAANYKFTPSAFIEIPSKYLFKKDQFSRAIKSFDVHSFDLVIEVKQHGKDQHWPSNFYVYNQLLSSKGTIGLSNLGNTCYMNSALQCLLHIPEFKDYFLYNGYEKEVNIENPLGHKGHIAWAFASMVQALFGKRHSAATSYSPRNFKNTIGHLNSMFSGYQQQDSQEFLAFLLDGLHEDLNRIIEKPYVEKPELTSTDDTAEFKVIKKLADDTWGKHKLRNDSVITDLFVGLYKSTLICPVCKKTSVTFDPYNDLTLPLPVNSTWSNKVLIFPHNSHPYSLEVELKKTDTYQQLKEYVAKCANVDPANLFGAEVFNHQFYNNYEAPNSESQYLPIHELIGDSDVVVFYEIPRSEDSILIPVMNTIIEAGFKSAKLCGYPFFISLTKKEQSHYGIILEKLENAFLNLSGGFTEFPIISRKISDLTLESLPLLSEKIANPPTKELAAHLSYINPDETPNRMFDVKLYNGSGNQYNSNDNTADEPVRIKEVWTPEPHVTFSKVSDITERLNPIVKDAYFYAELASAHEQQQSAITLPDSGDILDDTGLNLLTTSTQEAGCVQLSSPNPESAQLSELGPTKTDSVEAMHLPLPSDSDMDIEVYSELDMNKQTLSKDPSQAPLTQSASAYSGPAPLLVDFQNALICEWKSEKYEEVFHSSVPYSWERPDTLRNEELEVIREKRRASGEKKITLHDCLTLFSTPEVLGATDSWFCPNCKEHRQATKQIELWNAPDILLIHLKRFENQRSFSDKIADTVHFPITDLDMTPYLVYKNEDKGDIYDLIAVDNHYGGLGGGHYTAYVKNIDGKWYYFDDSRVSETLPERSIAGSAYLLFYRRRVESGYLGTERLSQIILESRQKHEQVLKKFSEAVIDLYSESKSDDEEEEEKNEEKNRENSFLMPSREDETNAGQQEEPSQLETESSVPQPDKKGAYPLKGMVSPHSEYSIASLEVGDGEKIDESGDIDHNNSRRKLRLLQKTYNSHSSDVATSGSSSSSSTGAVVEEIQEAENIDHKRN
ncbi:AFR627Cp [Eremothecium gossypii ATCC 10895]|uniref:ubiquitinyl hydrolase 1 n=1 Tax=Eremothecium gossypii (strain ATCC 10895 / CBS 109.51 / FGSC 9923 / NRRL Y-1056) TaxID=284811 RepID=Q752E9_EREGS|nr:AFR627Cp [Eremothecium gossypii ATCC 10895]AAS53998.2 AFR627Cp [Eremothecium gossypii ATCC 10895]AEY98312.1 FAFR627Cp [Eremothecium gossypii FDAG1]